VTGAGDSLKFDRAVGYYDRTRALPPEASRAVTGLLAAELRDRGPTIEIGAGTGRIALPLRDEGIELVGVDLSVAMLEQLVNNAGGSAPFPLACADATAIPIGTGSVGSAIACHVLHLIPDWRAALKEIVRVVRPGGIFLSDLGGWGRVYGDPHRSIMRRWAEVAGIELKHRGVEEVAQVSDAMAELGWTARELPVIYSTRTYTLGELLEALADGVWSCTWHAPGEARRAAALEVKPWVEKTFGDLSEARQHAIKIEWNAYESPEVSRPFIP
jgi:SAM-dependent methyltransferase